MSCAATTDRTGSETSARFQQTSHFQARGSGHHRHSADLPSRKVGRVVPISESRARCPTFARSRSE